MTHIEDDDMVLHFYGEADDRRAVEAHLAACPACRGRLDALSADMAEMAAMAVPERGDDYGAQVWARIQPVLEAAPPSRWWRRWFPVRVTWPRLAMAGGVAALVVAAFVAGRYGQAPPTPVVVQAEAPAAVVRERILLVAVGEHLSRSRVVLAEISNRNGGTTVDISAEQATAEDLIAANRLYRQTAASSGDPAIAGVLEDLERMLVEIANSPRSASAGDLARLRDRIESQGLLFKVTVLGSQAQQRQLDAAAPSASRTKAST